MQPKAKHKSSRAGAAKTRTETCEIVEEKQKLLDIRERKENAREVGTNNKITCVEVYFSQRTIDKYSACVEVGKPIDENSACVEVGTTHKHLRRGDKSNNFKNCFSSNDITCEEVKSVDSQRFFFIGYIVRASNKGAREKKKGRIFLNFYKMYKNALKEDLIRVVENLDGTVESTDTIVKLKTKIENSSTFESDPDFVKTLIQNCIDERVSQNEREVTSEQKIELAKLQLAKLEKEIELQLAKNKALSLNPATKVEEKQFETNIENMIKSIKTLSLPVPTRSENFNLFFQSLERAFLTKKINDEYKSEILINLLGERAHNVLLYIKEEELNDYEKLKSIVLREFQLTPRECLNSFKNAVKSSGETYIQFAARLTANFQYYCSLRKVNSFESLCDLIISDKLYETLNKETATHIGIREAEDWFRPIDLAKECDIYISSRSGSHKEIPITYGYTQDPFKNKSQNFKTKIKENYPQYHEREKCSDIVLCKKANGAMKTSSVEFISQSPTPSPMNSNYRRFVLLRKIFEPWQWKRRKKRNRFEQTSRTLQRKISMRSTKDQLVVKKDVLMPVKHNVFLWNLPDVEEVPSHDGETV
ncbi:integrase catalytic domain-containing protein [Trichonephila clavipes]|nr:integrase catalytic domain-containing protein [Trichonephila clavipes]